MKQLLFSIFFLITFLGLSSSTLKAQNVRNYIGNQQKSDDALVVAYPNPAKDFIVLKTKNPLTRVKSVTFYSIVGAQVMEVFPNSNYVEIRLDKLIYGKYLIKYTLSDNTQQVTQIIKQ
ncbi:T9SS type A sorting domain-containing protein [Riemerella anatipestifer]|uniref:T9SS type A sorting domain-containing protein n=1 Tax=Riemerella anatipestifer TaxID=34085 RepID=UPI0021F89B90|nr:T9SS type A sorting domain-containing protein [Riemerella anatipestifer]MCW0518749.1 T9SS type A sorting domain-containing protein [Riemerella anatipestifer]